MATEGEGAAEVTRLQAEQALLQVLESGGVADELHAAIKAARCHTNQVPALSSVLAIACERLRAMEAEERASQLAVSNEMSLQRIEELIQCNESQMQHIKELEEQADGGRAELKTLQKKMDNALELASKETHRAKVC